MLRRIARLLIGEYIDLLGVVVAIMGFACLIIAALLAYARIEGFAIAFIIIGTMLITIGFVGAKLIGAMVERVLK